MKRRSSLPDEMAAIPNFGPPATDSRQRRRLLAAAVLVLFVGLAGVGVMVSRDDHGLTIPPEAVDPDAVSGPGTPLGEDFTVAEGSALIGLPIPGSAGRPGFSAYLFVDGEPGQVVDAYLAQAAAKGFEPLLAPNDGDGFEAGPIPADRNRVGRCGLELSQEPSIAPRYVCAVTAVDAHGRCFDISVVRGERWSHGFVWLYEPSQSLGGCYASSIVGDLDESPPTVPTDWPIRPQEGAELGPQFGWLGVPVQPGSHVAAASVPGADFGFCADVAVLQVTGEPSAVLDSYVTGVRAVLPLGDLPWGSDSGTMDGVSLEERSVMVPGGGSTYVLDLVTAQDGRAFLYAYSCSD